VRFNLRHIQFCDEYLANGGNATDAYQTIYGCTRTSAYTLGPKLLDHPDVQTLLQNGKRKAMKKFHVTAERVIQELACIAFLDVIHLYNEDGSLKKLEEMPEEARRAIASIDVDELFHGMGEDRELVGYTKKLKTEGKREALKLLGQTLAMFVEKKLIEGDHTHQVSVNDVDLDERIARLTGEVAVDPFA